MTSIPKLNSTVISHHPLLHWSQKLKIYFCSKLRCGTIIGATVSRNVLFSKPEGTINQKTQAQCENIMYTWEWSGRSSQRCVCIPCFSLLLLLLLRSGLTILGWLQTCSAAEDDLELLFLLPALPSPWVYRCVPPCTLYAVVESKFRVSCMLCKRPTNLATPPSIL